MSRKSRKRHERYKEIRSDDYFSNGEFEIARFGTNTLLKNNRTFEQQKAYMEYLQEEYTAKYSVISQKIDEIKEKTVQCDPYSLLMRLRNASIFFQINLFSESEYSNKANAIIRAQEYIQSLLVSTENQYDGSSFEEEQETLYEQIIDDFYDIYDEMKTFYYYWAAYAKKNSDISDDRLNIVVEAQYMYWVRGNRYQIFELEPIRRLLPPHNAVLQELFGVSASDVIIGLEKLQYSLSQGYADAMMDFGKEYEHVITAMESGMTPETAFRSRESCTNALAAKIFGSDLINVKLITGWDTRFIDALSFQIGECLSFRDESDFSGWPIVELPVMRKPFIKIEDTAYAFLYYALFDNIYRNIQRIITQQKPEYKERWKAEQTRASEEMVANLFTTILPGAEVHIGNYYPVNTSLKQMNENDIIIIYMNYLFIIEVKAGSFPSTPPITDFNAHINAYHKLAEAADSQCSRTLSYISKHVPAQFYNHEKVLQFSLSLDSFDDIFTFSVTVDNFNEFAAKAEKLNVISLKEKTIVISYDDLLAYAGYFTSPILFLHYLKQRKAVISTPEYQINDELDHLGLYIHRNLYTLHPSPYGAHRVIPYGFRAELDKYFGMLFVNSETVEKPFPNIPIEISEIIEFLENEISLENIRLAHYLLDLCTETKEDFANQIRYAQTRQRELGQGVPIIAFGETKFCAFVTIPGISQYTLSAQLDYTYAAASRNETIPVMWISLEYNERNILVSAEGKKCYFSDLKGENIERIKRMGCEMAKDWVKLNKRMYKKIGRNDACPCGSGKKYKFCCLRYE